jgi:hypothetical protein
MYQNIDIFGLFGLFSKEVCIFILELHSLISSKRKIAKIAISNLLKNTAEQSTIELYSLCIVM